MTPTTRAVLAQAAEALRAMLKKQGKWESRANDMARSALHAIESELKAAEPMPGPGGWIEWSSGECPVPPGTRVIVRFASGCDNPHHTADVWGWIRWGTDSDIIAYLVLSPK